MVSLLFVSLNNSSPHVPADRDDEAHGILVESAQRGRVEEVCRAKAFARIDGIKHYGHLGCVGIGEYGRRIGYSARHAREYAAAGRVLRLFPAAEEALLLGAVSITRLAVMEPFYVEPELRPVDAGAEPKDDEALFQWAKALPERRLRQIVHQRREELRIGSRPAVRILHLNQQGAEDLDRTQVLASRTADRNLSHSEAAEHAFRFYVEKKDVLEKAAGKRRLPGMPPRTDGSRNPRGLAAEVTRTLMEKHGDVCAIEFCQNRIFLENSHHTPHALGGGNEVEDQERICSPHHGMEDNGRIRWVADKSEPGGGHYVTREGKILRLKPVVKPIAKPPGPDAPSEAPNDVPREDPPDQVRDDQVQERAPALIASRQLARAENREERGREGKRPKSFGGPMRSWRHATRPQPVGRSHAR